MFIWHTVSQSWLNSLTMCQMYSRLPGRPNWPCVLLCASRVAKKSVPARIRTKYAALQNESMTICSLAMKMCNYSLTLTKGSIECHFDYWYFAVTLIPPAVEPLPSPNSGQFLSGSPRTVCSENLCLFSNNWKVENHGVLWRGLYFSLCPLLFVQVYSLHIRHEVNNSARINRKAV